MNTHLLIEVLVVLAIACCVVWLFRTLMALRMRLPAEAIIESEVRIVTYLTPEGQRQTQYRISPDVDAVTIVGILYETVHDLLHADLWELDAGT